MPKAYLPLAILACCLLAAYPTAQNVAVWGFTPEEGIDPVIADSFTRAFEESLVNHGGFNIIERREIERLKEAINKEGKLQSAAEISPENIAKLKVLGVQMVVFGEVYDDVASGDASIEVTFLTLEGTKSIMGSVLMKRSIINDAEARKSKMKELVESLKLPKRAGIEMITGKRPGEDDPDDPEGIIRAAELNNLSRAAERLVKEGKLGEAIEKLEAFRREYPGTPQAEAAALEIDQIREGRQKHE